MNFLKSVTGTKATGGAARAILARHESHGRRAMIVDAILHTRPGLEHLQHRRRRDLHFLSELADLLIGLIEVRDNNDCKRVLGNDLKNRQIGLGRYHPSGAGQP